MVEGEHTTPVSSPKKTEGGNFGKRKNEASPVLKTMPSETLIEVDENEEQHHHHGARPSAANAEPTEESLMQDQEITNRINSQKAEVFPGSVLKKREVLRDDLDDRESIESVDSVLQQLTSRHQPMTSPPKPLNLTRKKGSLFGRASLMVRDSIASLYNGARTISMDGYLTRGEAIRAHNTQKKRAQLHMGIEADLGSTQMNSPNNSDQMYASHQIDDPIETLQTHFPGQGVKTGSGKSGSQLNECYVKPYKRASINEEPADVMELKYSNPRDTETSRATSAGITHIPLHLLRIPVMAYTRTVRPAARRVFVAVLTSASFLLREITHQRYFYYRYLIPRFARRNRVGLFISWLWSLMWGFVSYSFTVVLKGIVMLLAFPPRIDRPRVNRLKELEADSGFASYLGFLNMESNENNSIVISFCQVLLAHTSAGRRYRHSILDQVHRVKLREKVITMERSKRRQGENGLKAPMVERESVSYRRIRHPIVPVNRARLRWYKAYTLIRNPCLLYSVKGRFGVGEEGAKRTKVVPGLQQAN